ncbi:MAG: ornithine cyclodeaminase [Paracoccaceae bacterium]|nr:MAG: ornithine cyclodeaminase [Paracoccaceae bacterium]
MKGVALIGPADLAGRLDWPAVVAAIEAGHRLPPPALGDTFLHRGAEVLLSRSAWVDGLGAGVKSVTVFPDNRARDLPSVQGAMILFDDATGTVRAVIDSALITRWKTAADSVLGARILARPDARVLTILGAGAVADSLIEAYRAILPGIARILVWNRSPGRAEALAAAHRGAHPVEATRDLPAAVAAADIVATATMAHQPVLHGEWVRPGTHVDLIGAFTATMREADDALLTRGRIFVDCRETTLDHIGELKDPLARGVIRREDVQGDLYDLVAGRAGRRGAEEITIFKNGGGAHLDLMTAGAILKALG